MVLILEYQDQEFLDVKRDDEAMNINKQEMFALALSFMGKEEQETLWEYIVLTNYGQRSVSLERQASLRVLLQQLMKQEKLDSLDLPSRLYQLTRIKHRILEERGLFLELFSE